MIGSSMMAFDVITILSDDICTLSAFTVFAAARPSRDTDDDNISMAACSFALVVARFPREILAGPILFAVNSS